MSCCCATLNPNAAFDDLSAEKFRFARKVSIAASIGTAIEFTISSSTPLAAALVFRSQFFPNMDPVTGTAVSIATFAAGYLSRPIGAAITATRRPVRPQNMLIISMMTMGAATFLIDACHGGDDRPAAPILLILPGHQVPASAASRAAHRDGYGVREGDCAACSPASPRAASRRRRHRQSGAPPEAVTSPEWFQRSAGASCSRSASCDRRRAYVRFNIGESPAFIALQKSAPAPIPFSSFIVNHWPKVIRVLLLIS